MCIFEKGFYFLFHCQIQSNSIIVEKWSTQIFLLYWIFLLFWIFVLFKEIDYVEKAGYIRAVFLCLKIVVTLSATEGFEKTLCCLRRLAGD